jgi:hypothetical protein
LKISKNKKSRYIGPKYGSGFDRRSFEGSGSLGIDKLRRGQAVDKDRR